TSPATSHATTGARATSTAIQTALTPPPPPASAASARATCRARPGRTRPRPARIPGTGRGRGRPPAAGRAPTDAARSRRRRTPRAGTSPPAPADRGGRGGHGRDRARGRVGPIRSQPCPDGTCSAGGHLVLGPAVVRLAGRRALDLRDPDDPLGQLVPREALAQEGPQLVVGGLLLAVAVLDHRGDHLAVPLVRGAGDHRVEHGGVRFERLLHLFREDLLAGGVDGARAAAEEDDRAVLVDPGHVAQDRHPYTVDDREGAGRLLRVVVVPQRDMARAGQETDLVAARLDGREVLADHPQPRPGGQPH